MQNVENTPIGPVGTRLWTIKEAAEFLRVSERYLRDSDCPRIRLQDRSPDSPRLIRFGPTVVLAWLDQWRTDGGDQASWGAN